MDLLNLEDGGTTFLCNVGNRLPNGNSINSISVDFCSSNPEGGYGPQDTEHASSI